MRDRSSSVKGGLDNVLFDVWLVSRATTDLLDTALAPSGLTADEFAIYSVLMREGTITPTELARWMAAPPTTVSSYVRRLEGRGDVERQPHPQDGRSYQLRLTPSGRRAHRAAARYFLPVLHELTAELGEQRPAVQKALTHLHQAVGRQRVAPHNPQGPGST